MTQENRELVLKDLTYRLRYGVKILHETWNYEWDDEMSLIERVVGIDEHFVYTHVIDTHTGEEYREEKHPIELFDSKMYLRPMSSMTEEELNECVCQYGIKDIECPNWQDIPKEKQFEARLNHAIAVFLTDSNNVDWLNAHHFDYRGLIEKGLALEAKEDMYKN
jgi:hypothetical protein